MLFGFGQKTCLVLVESNVFGFGRQFFLVWVDAFFGFGHFFGFDQEKQAYIVRNSWGGVGSGNTNFGVSPFPPYEPYHQLPDGNWTKGGYFLLKYGENTCGIGTAGIKMPKLARYDMYNIK